MANQSNTNQTKTEEQKRKEAAERMAKARAAKKAAQEEAKRDDELVKKLNEVDEVFAVGLEAVAEALEKADDKGKEPTFTKDEVQRMIMEALARQRDEIRPQVITVSPETEKVLLRFQAEIADDNVAVFGAGGYYGQITGKTGMLSVPKSEFTSRFLDENARWMLKQRWLVVLSGLDEQERELFGVNYREGEVLDEMAFMKLLDMKAEELLEVYPKLCMSYKEMVARRFVTAFHNGDVRVTTKRALVKSLNDMSKADYKDLPDSDPRRKGAFASILEEMNKRDV